jgi:hypothetical protein
MKQISVSMCPYMSLNTYTTTGLLSGKEVDPVVLGFPMNTEASATPLKSNLWSDGTLN